MKKVLLAVLVIFIATAVYAGDKVDPLSSTSQAVRDKTYKIFGTPQVQFDISGEFSARGYYWDNAALKSDDTVTNSYYQGYIDLFPKLKVGNTTLITKIEMVDQSPWAKFDSSIGDTNKSELFDASYDKYSTSKNDNLSLERAYIHHDFNENLFTEVGLMDGQWWGTTFSDNQAPKWRVKFQGKTAVGVVGALVEKIAETGNSTVEDSEKDDYDAYALYGVTKVGDLTIEPLFFYHVDSAYYRPGLIPLGPTSAATTGIQSFTALDNGNNGVQVLYIALASKGKIGPLGMEAELGYISRDAKDIGTYITNTVTATGATSNTPTTYFDNDWKEYGAYLNLWNDMDFGRIGGKFAWGSYDEDGGLRLPNGAYTGAGFDFRQDFKSNLILGDEIPLGTGGVNEDLTGMTLIQPYVKTVKLGIDKLTGSASFGYIISNQKDNNYDGLTAWETDLGVQYKLSDNLLYKVDGGYAQISVDKDKQSATSLWAKDDPDPIMVLKHEILFTF